MKNKKIVISIIILVVVFLLGAAYLLFTKPQSKPEVANNIPQKTILTLSPQDIGLSLSYETSGKYTDHAILVQITQLKGITGIEYELSYNADNLEEIGEKIPRGAIGQLDIKTSMTTLSQEVVLGTCSDVCHYDEGVTDIKIVLKITRTDGNTYLVTESMK